MELIIISLGIIGLVFAIIIIALVVIYNSLISTEKRVENSWAQIDVQLKRRADLIPNLINTVKGYAKFEKKVLTEVTKARTAMVNAKGPKDAAKADDKLSSALKSIFAVAESYPSLKASKNFIQLQEELTSTENKISFARQFYNDMVMKWNTLIEVFPSNIVAGLFGKNKSKEFFEANVSEKKNVKVDFSDMK
jgi:LemA protein